MVAFMTDKALPMKVKKNIIENLVRFIFFRQLRNNFIRCKLKYESDVNPQMECVRMRSKTSGLLMCFDFRVTTVQQHPYD